MPRPDQINDPNLQRPKWADESRMAWRRAQARKKVQHQLSTDLLRISTFQVSSVPCY